jgi:oxygen-independent coproporphyrinogen-3 oxidase
MSKGADDNYPASGAVRHIYVHIPFCARICPYCALYKTRPDRSQTDRFCEAILAELRASNASLDGTGKTGRSGGIDARPSGRDASTPSRLQPETLFFGGGTPTALTTAQIEKLLAGFAAELDLSHLREWTFEANPGSVSERKARLLRQGGVNRISLGVQSFDDSLLRLLGRDHSAAHAEATFQLLRQAGFENVNVDLMFGLPGQTLTQWENSLRRALALAPDHISTYCLTYEEDTEFLQRHKQGELRSDPEADADFFALADELLGGAGFEHYEVSNYARPGFQSIHNQAYWGGKDYLGIGPSAVSTLGFRRWTNVADYRLYADRILQGEPVSTRHEILTPQMKRAEAIALSLRTDRGVPAAWIEEQADEIKEFVRLGLMKPADQRYVLTRAGRFLADSVAEAFV